MISNARLDYIDKTNPSFMPPGTPEARIEELVRELRRLRRFRDYLTEDDVALHDVHTMVKEMFPDE